jgi:hypothetical protein
MGDVVDVGKGRGDENIPLALLGENLLALAHSTAWAYAYARCDSMCMCLRKIGASVQSLWWVKEWRVSSAVKFRLWRGPNCC